jgi:hypothetical protein
MEARAARAQLLARERAFRERVEEAELRGGEQNLRPLEAAGLCRRSSRERCPACPDTIPRCSGLATCLAQAFTSLNFSRAALRARSAAQTARGPRAARPSRTSSFATIMARTSSDTTSGGRRTPRAASVTSRPSAVSAIWYLRDGRHAARGGLRRWIGCTRTVPPLRARELEHVRRTGPRCAMMRGTCRPHGHGSSVTVTRVGDLEADERLGAAVEVRHEHLVALTSGRAPAGSARRRLRRCTRPRTREGPRARDTRSP